MKAPRCYEQNTGHPIPEQVPTDPRNTLVRINIRHRGPSRSRAAQNSLIWTTHDVPGDTELCELFRLHHSKGGQQPQRGVLLQQIDRNLEHVSGTEKYWWAELAREKVMDLNWVFEDGEVWLSCLMDEV